MARFQEGSECEREDGAGRVLLRQNRVVCQRNGQCDADHRNAAPHQAGRRERRQNNRGEAEALSDCAADGLITPVSAVG